MTYTAVLKDEDRFLYIYEGDVYMGYLHDFTTVNIAKAFQDAINGVIPLNIASELFAEVDFVNEEDGGYYTIFIGDADDAWCFVGGCGHEEALELAEALIQQIKEQEGK